MIITAQNINKSYSIDGKNQNRILKDISVSFESGDFVALIGASGAGKSTLLHILSSIDKADSGSISFYSDDSKIYEYSKMNSDSLAMMRNKDIGFVFQFHHLLPEFTALENVMMPLMLAGVNQKVAKETALEIISFFKLEDRISHKPNELSGGEQQRFAIARAIVNKPKILFADEPTGNLDSENTEIVLSILNDINSKYGITLIVATHSERVANSAKKIIRMADGKIV